LPALFVVVVLLVLACTSLFMVAVLARRDHADRSVEFWLSMPVSHSASFAVPLIVHLLIVPMAAVLVGLVAGEVVSLLALTRLAGVDAWVGLPWPAIIGATLALTARLLVGIPLAVAWILPLVLLYVLSTALLRRWGVLALLLLFVLGNGAALRLFGSQLLNDWSRTVLSQAGQALFNPSAFQLQPAAAQDLTQELPNVAGAVLHDIGSALTGLLNPVFLLGVVISLAAFTALIVWRKRGVNSTS
jgi:hypothetical protein